MTKILKMAAADCLQPSVRSQNVFCAGESLSPSTPPSAGANNVEQWGVWLCEPVLLELLSPTLSPSSSQSHVGGERGGALELLDAVSPHKEKTPGAQLRSCGWQAIFQFLYPSSHPPITWGPLPTRMAPGWEQPIPLSRPRHLWKLGWAHTIKTSPLQAAGTAQLWRARSRDWGGLRSPFCLQLPLFVNKHSSASSPPPESRFCWREKSCTISALDVKKKKKSEIAWRLAAAGGRLGEAGAGIRAVIAGHLSVPAPAFAGGACSQASQQGCGKDRAIPPFLTVPQQR